MSLETPEAFKGPTEPSGSGVVQGSKLGPTCFLLYIDSLVRELKKEFGASTIRTLYCDDLNILISGSSDEDCESTAQQVTNRVSKWANDHKLGMNKKKLKLASFYR